jgi:hypothetical protein
VARIRTIKPEFPQSESIGSCRATRGFCSSSSGPCGRRGEGSRGLANAREPSVPLRRRRARSLIDGWLTELENSKGCIRRYDVDGSHYLEIANWLKHQKIDRPSTNRACLNIAEPSPKPREPSRTSRLT